MASGLRHSSHGKADSPNFLFLDHTESQSDAECNPINCKKPSGGESVRPSRARNMVTVSSELTYLDVLLIPILLLASSLLPSLQTGIAAGLAKLSKLGL